jgi:hypothetical protein
MVMPTSCSNRRVKVREDMPSFLLIPVYRRFTEGFETQDLVAASRLLQRVRADG